MQGTKKKKQKKKNKQTNKQPRNYGCCDCIINRLFRRRFAVAALKQLPSDTSQLEAKLAVAATMAGNIAVDSRASLRKKPAAAAGASASASPMSPTSTGSGPIEPLAEGGEEWWSIERLTQRYVGRPCAGAQDRHFVVFIVSRRVLLCKQLRQHRLRLRCSCDGNMRVRCCASARSSTVAERWRC